MTQPISGIGQFGRKGDVLLNRVRQNDQAHTSFFICLSVAKIIQVHGEMSAFFVCWFINDLVLIGSRVPQAPLCISNWWNVNRVDGRYTQFVVGILSWFNVF